MAPKERWLCGVVECGVVTLFTNGVASRGVVISPDTSLPQEEAIAEAKAMEARSIQMECQSDLAAAMPAVEAAIAAVQSIKKEHLVEVKAMANPPSNVKLVMESLCIIFGVGTRRNGLKSLAAYCCLFPARSPRHPCISN